MDDTRHRAVGSTAPVRPSPLPLTERQEARRRRILEASTALACGGGFDAVQMREVAETSEVALGTLYRYFPSKVHLLVAVMEDQLSRLHATLRERPPASAAPSERVAETLLRAFRALQREPLLADAMVRAMIFADRSVSADVDTVSRLTTTIIADAAGGTAAGPPGRAARASAGAPGGTAETRTAGAATGGRAGGGSGAPGDGTGNGSGEGKANATGNGSGDRTANAPGNGSGDGTAARTPGAATGGTGGTGDAGSTGAGTRGAAADADRVLGRAAATAAGGTADGPTDTGTDTGTGAGAGARTGTDTGTRTGTRTGTDTGTDGDGDGLDASAVRVIEHTWHAALVAWLSGRATVAQVTADIRTACRLLDAPA